ncbi:Deoxyhypusine hydroxylase [Saitoella complicata NRRL Y-17804]|uniref:Deoxyhypusine hydroxylase n=1 Tax=Saitoella complicata (strain BCRC 22490 / CBS 7301 / JCM 7358 / NBRC 10748 / NRRL Y-17804) TaxID=698492 RepID=A0A0E9NAI3_SAICN|nr:Deoxyhypusine hydroxylase [Saitoella complicata NRRL Y-17804]ODQ53957.1 Deoxyhypusine hydroxylase [Saitoella complicata NRRL Y-17804]GAO46823.1 hypothetical protein G7K_1041-t1 [Saitoella complicata NRRL Y-17804]
MGGLDTRDSTLDALEETLLNKSGDVPLALRFRALFSLKALGTEGNVRAIEIIAEGLKDDSALLKHELAYVLGQTRQEAAVVPLQLSLKNLSEDPMVRHEAAEALGALGDQGSLPLLREYLHDKEEVVRQTCELAIERIEWETSEKSKTEKIQKSAYTSIDPAPPLPLDGDEHDEKVEKLQQKLNDQSLSLFHRYRAMFRLRDIGTPAAIDALASGFSDPSALFRHEIAYVFGQLSHPHSVPALISVLRNTREESMVRHEAAEALGSVGTAECLPVLKEFSTDEEQVVRESCVVAVDMWEHENSGEVEYAVYAPKVEA